jgi:GTP-binding protein
MVMPQCQWRQKAWQKELENYLIKRESLQGLILLMDVRHPLQKYDEMLC